MQIWTIQITAPTGNFAATLRIEGVTGEMAGKAGSGPMQDLRQGAGTIAWTTQIERPMPMKLKFDGVIAGDHMSGSVKFGIFAKGTFAGSRAA